MSSHLEVHLLRHAHSSHAVAGERDHSRGLDARGEREVERLRARLAREPVRLEAVVCSTARRARLTLAPLLPVLGPVPVRYDDGLYALGADAYADAVRSAGHARSLLLVGHNPTIETVLRSWCPQDAAELSQAIGTAVWATVGLRRAPDGSLGDGRLLRLLPPP